MTPELVLDYRNALLLGKLPQETTTEELNNEGNGRN